MKRSLAAISVTSIIAALLGAGPAHAADSTITGSVSNGSITVSSGMVYYYATCEDYQVYNDADRSVISAGTYAVTVPDGTYRVRIAPDAGQNAVESWHSAKASCEQADLVTVSGNGIRNLVARFGYNVTGTVTSSNGQVLGGNVAFYTSCRAYRNNNAAGSVSFSGGVYSITVPTGTYYALITPGNGTRAVESWHNAQALCTNATAIVINGNTPGMTLRPLAGTNLSGTIGSSRGPISSAIIQFFETCEDFEDNNETAYVYPSGGTYAITLPAGTYRVRITMFGNSDGALDSWHNAVGTCAGATTISVSGLTDTENLLARTAALVSGSVTRTGGGALTGGSVTFYENCQAHSWGKSAGYGYIDGSGQYEAAVPPGTYVVQIFPDGGDGALASWHNGVTACDQATSISVPGDSTRNLVAATGHVVTGAVTSSSGPVEDGYVSFYASCEDEAAEDAVSIDAGTYTISLPAGTYRVRIQPGDGDPAVLSWHNAKSTCEMADVVTVAGSGPVDLVATGAARVTGQVASANGSVKTGYVGFFATCEDYTANEPSAWTWIGDGKYAATIPNGTYRVLIEPSLSSDSVRSWHSAAAACDQATVVTVNGNTTIDPVAATGTHLTGAVTSSNGSVSSGSVLFFSSCQAYQDWNGSGHSSIKNGQYSVWLPPGTYLAMIRPSTDTAAHSWHNAKNNCAAADVITVAGSSMSLGLVASPGVDVTGLVTKGGKPIAYGQVEFFATCQDFLAGQPSNSAMIDDGLYTLTLAPGPYRARITAMGQNGEKYSWHSTTGTCGSATPVSVSGSTTANLQARTTSSISGSVSGPDGLLSWGSLEFFATCQDYLDGNPTAFAQFEAGAYTIGVPDGSYLVRVNPNKGAAISWHNAANGCGSATAITVSGTHNIVAARGAVVTGSVSSSAGPVKGVYMEFFPDCQAYYRNEPAGRTITTTTTYSLNIVPGTYRVLIQPKAGTGARKSWHAAKASCETADLVTITGDAWVDLVALPKYAPVVPPPVNPDPPGPPSAKSGQTVKKPSKRLKKGKKVRLAKRTRQGTKLTWKSRTKKVCTVKKNVLTAKKKGKCKISASAPATPSFTAFSKRYTIRVR